MVLLCIVLYVRRKTIHFVETLVTPQFHKAVFQHFPVNKNSLILIKLLDHILFGSWFDEDSDLLVLESELIMTMRKKTAPTHNFSAKKLFDRFSKEIFPIQVKYHEHLRGKARLLEDAQVPEWLEVAKAEMLLGDRADRTVGLVSGKPIKLADHYAEKRQQAMADALNARSETVKKVLGYLHELPEFLFDGLDSKLPGAFAVASKLPNPVTRRRSESMLTSVQLYPKPLYQQADKTARIYGIGGGFLNLKSEVRNRLTSDWVKIDLKHAQLSIISKLWDLPGLRKYVDGIKGGFWKGLCTECGIPYIDDVKSAMKEALYSVIFGSHEHQVKYRLLPVIGSKSAEVLVNHFVFKSLFTARKKRYLALCEDWALKDAYGNESNLVGWTSEQKRYRMAMSMLACQAQSYELAILAPIFDYAVKTQGTEHPFWVTAFLHDGLWIQCDSESAMDHVGHIKDLVAASSLELLGESMVVDVEYPDSWFKLDQLPKPLETNQSAIWSQLDFDSSALIPEAASSS